jgi:hypothetical protein
MFGGFFMKMSQLFESEKITGIFDAYLNGSEIPEISENFELTKERVKQLLQRGKIRMANKMNKINSWIDVFGDTKYAEMDPKSVLRNFNALEEENAELKLKLQRFVEGNPDDVLQEMKADMEKEKKLLTPITELDLSVRAFQNLQSAQIATLKDLVAYSAEDLLKFRNFGQKSLCEVEEVLGSLGLSLAK